jgi:hypothetical protein
LQLGFDSDGLAALAGERAAGGHLQHIILRQ